MFDSKKILALLASSGAFVAADVLWDGRFNDLTSSEDLNNWSFSNEVGPYQYYIHGSGNVTEYVNLSADYKNPADTASTKGVKITIDQTSQWEGQTMLRTELIPQTTAAINAGKVYYHFSMKRSDTNAPSVDMEHQVNFFESHFTEMKYGWINGESGTEDPNLQWMVSSQSQWKTAFTADSWFNFAYEIDFDGQTVGLWGSNGSDPLTQIIAPVSASASSNGADWHLGVLRLPRDGYTDSPTEDWYFSGVYIESGELTKTVTGPASSGSAETSSGTASSATSASSAVASSSAAPATSAAAVASASASASAAVTTSSSSAAAVASSVPVSTVTLTPIPASEVSASVASSSAPASTSSKPATTSTPVTTSAAPVSTSTPPSSSSTSPATTSAAVSSSKKPCKRLAHPFTA